MSQHGTDESVALEWRRLTPTLWVCLGAYGVVGCIEIGRRCQITDGEGHVFGRFRRLDDAKAMLVLRCGLHADGTVGGRYGDRAAGSMPLAA